MPTDSVPIDTKQGLQWTHPVPRAMRNLPRNKAGYLVPWFVDDRFEGDEPDFRVMGGGKIRAAVQFGLCWVCGGPMGRYRTYVAGPMCGINRTSAEPPSHHDCALYSAQVCPFLTRPSMVRRDTGLENRIAPPGFMLERNPGVTLLWTTAGGTRPFRVGEGVLFDIGDPDRLEFFAQGRAATREEIVTSVQTGLPALREVADKHGELPQLQRANDAFMYLVSQWVAA